MYVCMYVCMCVCMYSSGKKKSYQSGAVNTLESRSYVISKSPGIRSKVADRQSYSGITV